MTKSIEYIQQVKELKVECSKDKGKYNKNKFVEYLAIELKIKGLYDSLEENVVVMHREIAIIREVLTNKDKNIRLYKTNT
nr:hypothetical protein [uncultured Lysinibacillus sp.]